MCNGGKKEYEIDVWCVPMRKLEISKESGGSRVNKSWWFLMRSATKL